MRVGTHQNHGCIILIARMAGKPTFIAPMAATLVTRGDSRPAVTRTLRSFVFPSEVLDARDDGRDRELLGDLASGRREALAELYDRHAASLFRHALALARRRPEAEDLVQAVFVKLATTGAQLLGVRAPASYLHRMLNSAWVASPLSSFGAMASHGFTSAANGGSAKAIRSHRRT